MIVAFALNEEHSTCNHFDYKNNPFIYGRYHEVSHDRSVLEFNKVIVLKKNWLKYYDNIQPQNYSTIINENYEINTDI